MILEIACFAYEDAMIAIEGGASRIELCKSQHYGGLTPSVSAARELCKVSPIPVFIMIRPADKDFIYNEEKFALMAKQISYFKKLKCDGFVFGALMKDGSINKKKCKELVRLAKPLPCTFHRAFDRVADPGQALEDVIECGFTRILTSGGPGKAHENLLMLKKLIKQAGKRIIIIPGGGVRAENALNTLNETRCKEIHSAATDRTRRRISLKEIKALKSIKA